MIITRDDMIWFLIGILSTNVITQIYLKAKFIKLLRNMDKAIEKEIGEKPIKKYIFNKLN